MHTCNCLAYGYIDSLTVYYQQISDKSLYTNEQEGLQVTRTLSNNLPSNLLGVTALEIFILGPIVLLHEPHHFITSCSR